MNIKVPIICLIIVWLWGGEIYATTPPLLLKADSISYCRPLNRLISKGHVLLFNNNRTIYSDCLVFDRLQGTIEAIGNVWFRAVDGGWAFSPRLQFKEGLSDGMMISPRVLMIDGSRFAADQASYTQEKTVLENVVYSPCKGCGKNTPLTWQLKAKQVIYDQSAETIYYYDATLDLLGMPILYSPYFYHPTPAVKRRSGFLSPLFGISKDLGIILGTPVYTVLADNHDMTITPVITSQKGPLLIGEYRHRAFNSKWLFHGSITRPTRSHLNRWHIISQGKVELTDTRVFSLDIKRASDTNYLWRYPFLLNHTYKLPTNKNLTSSVALEQFWPHSYTALHGYAFQTNDQAFTPFVAPLAMCDYQTEPGRYGETVFFNISVQALSRRRDLPQHFPKSSQRLSATCGSQVPYISPWGDEWRIEGLIRNDLYRIRHYRPYQLGEEKNFVRGRILPQAALHWSYPFISAHNNSSIWLLEPRAAIIASPYLKNSQALPNEDCDDVELDYTSLFKMNRFPGYDWLDSGNRFIYGINTNLLLPHQQKVGAFVGQSRRLDHKMVLPLGAGEDVVASNYIMSLNVAPASWFYVNHRSRLGRKDWRPKVSETYLSVSPTNSTTVQVGHIYLKTQPLFKQPLFNLLSVNQINWQISGAVTSNWKIAFGENRNLKRSTGGVLARILTLKYQNDCIDIVMGVYQTRYRDREIRPDLGMLFRVNFKNLGAIRPMTSPSSPGDIFGTFFA